MHDPLTLAFRIRVPKWAGGFELAEIWHKDPCRDGSDNSCGFGYPRPSEKQREALKSRAQREAREPYFLRQSGRVGVGHMRTESMLRQAIVEVARMIDVRVTADQVALLAAGHAIEFTDSFCFEPGWHTSTPDDTTRGREDVAFRLFRHVAALILDERRRWYQHPRWHVHHWRISVRWFSRWARRWIWLARDRCSHCRKRYSHRDVRTEGAIRHFWDSSAHASCCNKVAAFREQPEPSTPAASPQLVAGDGASKSGGRTDNGGGA